MNKTNVQSSLNRFNAEYQAFAKQLNTEYPFDLSEVKKQSPRLQAMLNYLVFYDLRYSYGEKVKDLIANYIRYDLQTQLANNTHDEDAVLANLIHNKQTVNDDFIYAVSDELKNDQPLSPVTNQHIDNQIQKIINQVQNQLQPSPTKMSRHTRVHIQAFNTLLDNLYSKSNQDAFIASEDFINLSIESYATAIKQDIGVYDDIYDRMTNDLHDMATSNDQSRDWDDPDSPVDFMGYDETNLDDMQDLINRIQILMRAPKTNLYYYSRHTWDYHETPLTVEAFTKLWNNYEHSEY